MGSKQPRRLGGGGGGLRGQQEQARHLDSGTIKVRHWRTLAHAVCWLESETVCQQCAQLRHNNITAPHTKKSPLHALYRVWAQLARLPLACCSHWRHQFVYMFCWAVYWSACFTHLCSWAIAFMISRSGGWCVVCAHVAVHTPCGLDCTHQAACIVENPWHRVVNARHMVSLMLPDGDY